jgi:hypothetical protein
MHSRLYFVCRSLLYMLVRRVRDRGFGYNSFFCVGNWKYHLVQIYGVTMVYQGGVFFAIDLMMVPSVFG